MLQRELGPVTVMGFARYRAKEGTDPVKLIAAARRWQMDFLMSQPGIALHCFLGNQSGDYADAILATDEAAFAAMSEAHLKHPSSMDFMAMLDTSSIRLARNLLTKPMVKLPQAFSCIEFGTFTPKDNRSFSEKGLLEASSRVEREYLSQHTESRDHYIGKIDDTTYSEICFVETEGAAREICGAYVQNEACLPLLSLFDPESVDLDFWHVLA